MDLRSSVVHEVPVSHPAQLEEMERRYSRGILFYLRRCGISLQQAHDHKRQILASVAGAGEDLASPDRLVWSLVRQITARVNGAGAHVPSPRGFCRNGSPPEATEIGAAVLRGIAESDAEALIRFYLKEQREEEICADMGLTGERFRHVRLDARARFHGRQLQLERKPPSQLPAAAPRRRMA